MIRRSHTAVAWAVLAAALVAWPVLQADTKPSKQTAALRSAADRQPVVKAWVYFEDKGPGVEARLLDAESRLHRQARARRIRNRGDRLVDIHDVPVYGAYLEALARTGAKPVHRSRWLNAVSVRASGDEIARIEDLSFVNRIDVVRHLKGPPLDVPDVSRERRPSDAPARGSASTTVFDYGPSFTQNDQINVTDMHTLGFRGQGVVIAVLDAGFNNLEHESFANMNIIDTYDFVNGDTNVDDELGQAGTGNHGIYVLSALGGYSWGDLIGPAFDAGYLLAKTENTDWERHVEEDDWIAGAEWADSLGADIISSSLGYLNGFTNGDTNYTWVDMDGNTTIVTIGADIAASRGILVVNSAGNEGAGVMGQNTLIGPADGDSVLAVGAVDASGVRAGFSSVGPTADGRTKPDVMAMGVFVYCASPFSTTGYLNINGTSLSCPLVAGAAALVLDANPSLSNMEIIQRLRDTASNASTPDDEMGWGIIDTHGAAFFTVSAVRPELPQRVTLYPAIPNPFNPTTTIRYELAQRAPVELVVYNVRGERVATLVDRIQDDGLHAVVWNGDNDAGIPVGSGVYLYTVSSGHERRSGKLTLLK